MRQSLRFLVSLSAAATVWGAGLSLASAQESSPTQNTPSQPPALPAAPSETGSPAPGYEPASPYISTNRTPMITVADPNEPVIDSTTRRSRRPNVPLLSTSSLLFVGSYLPTIIYQGAKDRNDNLYIPIAGPWMDLAQEGHHSTAAKTLLSMSGVLQGLGALGIVSSFFVPERKTKNWYLIGSSGRRRGISIAPHAARGSYGLGASGRF